MSKVKNEAAAKKPFFKSTAFKCIIVLLIIVLISGIFLTICNSLFYVSDAERLERALGKLYDDGESVSCETETIDSTISVDDATINSVYKITTIDGEYVLDVTGSGGFSGGTVTCYIRVYVDASASTCEVKKISISSNSGQSYISKIGTDDLQTLVDQQNASGFTAFSTDGITTGATYSLTAISNATNAAVTYMKGAYLGEVATDPYENFLYTSYINKNSTTYTGSDGVITYNIKTKSITPNSYTVTVVVGTDGTITSFTINSYGSYAGDKDYPALEYGSSFETYLVGKSQSDIEAIIGSGDNLTISNSTISSNTLFTGATESNFLCLYSALFATANYENCINALSAEVSQ